MKIRRKATNMCSLICRSTYFNSDLKFQSKKIILLLKIKNMYMYQIDCHWTPWIFDTTKNWHDGLFTLNWIFSTEQAFITIFVYDRVICLYIFFYCNHFSWGLYQKAWPWPYYFSDYVLTLTSIFLLANSF